MKRFLLFLMLVLNLGSIPIYAQKEMKDIDLTNIKTLLVAQWGNYVDLFLVSDLDLSALGMYSSITYDVREYVEKFGEYTMRDYTSDMRLVYKSDNVLYIKGFGFDPETGALVIEGPDSYLIANGKTGITYNENGERDDKGMASYDADGHIIEWSWARQKRPVTYSKSGMLESVVYTSDKFIFTWKNGLLTEISVCQNYGDKRENKHFWAEVVEKNSDGYWTELDIYRKDRDGEKVKKWRYSRKINK